MKIAMRAICYSLCGLVLLAGPLPAQSFRYEVDVGIAPEPETIAGLNGGPDRRVAVVVAPDESRDEFVVNEVILHAPDPAMLEAFITAHGAELILGGPLPPPPDSIAPEATRAEDAFTDYYLLRVDPDAADRSEFSSFMQQLEFSGTYRFSSDAAIGLCAIIAREQVTNGLNIQPNYITHPQSADCALSKTKEQATSTGGHDNAFTYSFLADSELGVVKAWQFLDVLGIQPASVNVAFVDAGFALNSDFPPAASVPQYDFVSGTYAVDGKKDPIYNWHGTVAYGLAAAIPDNQFGTAGTSGGTVSPYLFNLDNSIYSAALAIRTAVYWGAQVINCNIVALCSWSCRNFSSADNKIKDALSEALQAGAIVVTPAGNDGWDVNSVNLMPCVYQGALCVGGLDLSTKTAHSKSGHGANVDMWAPYNGLYSTPHPDSGGQIVTASGTCGSSAYTAGVVAMLKAVNPSLDWWSVKSVLQATANPSSDPKMQANGYINAYAAVKKAAEDSGRQPQGDAYEPNNSTAAAAALSPGSLTATIVPGDDDYFLFTTSDFMDILLSVTYKETALSSNALAAELDNTPAVSKAGGTLDLARKLLPPGTHVVHIFGGAEAINCYTVQFAATPAVILPDRFDDLKNAAPRNDTFAGRAVISPALQPTTAFITMDYIYDLSFDTAGDIDFFEVTLGDLAKACLDDTSGQGENFVQGSIKIQALGAVPGSTGPWDAKLPFDIRVYKPDGTAFTGFAAKSDYNLTIECPRESDFSGGRLIFSVADGNGYRNFYNIGIHYTLASSTARIPNVFDDVDPGAVRALPPEHEGTLPWMFPSDPAVIEQYMQGQLTGDIPAEYAVFGWEQAQNFDLRLMTEGDQDISLTLYNENRQMVAQTDIGPQMETAALALGDQDYSPDEGHIRVAAMPAGTYVLEFSGAEFGTVYSLSFGAGAYMLRLVPEGTGSGTVVSDPVGILCGAGCEELFQADTAVRLTAAPHEGSVFAGWEGEACSGTGDCLVAMEQDSCVTARFAAEDAAGSGLVVEPGFYSFGVIAPGQASEPAAFTVRNALPAEGFITLVAAVGEGADAYGIGFDGCTAQTLAPGQDCQVEVVLQPETEGVKPATLFIQAEAAAETIVTVEAELIGESLADAGTPDEDPEQQPCPAELLLRDSPDDLRLLRRLRDRVLDASLAGRLYSDLYYRHAPELAGVLAGHPDLASRAAGLLRRVAAQTSRADGEISLEVYAGGLALINELVGLSSVELRAALHQLQSALAYCGALSRCPQPDQTRNLRGKLYE